MVDKKDIQNLARLARLSVTEEEAEELHADMASILEYVDSLQSLELGEVQPMTYTLDTHNVFREDRVEQEEDTEAFLERSPERSGRFIKVPLIIDQDTDS